MKKKLKISYTFKFNKNILDGIAQVAKNENRNFNNAAETLLYRQLKHFTSADINIYFPDESSTKEG